MAQIVERKAGRLTGRSFLLCPKCRVDFFKKDIKESLISTDNKIKLSNWNKEESEIWTPK